MQVNTLNPGEVGFCGKPATVARLEITTDHPDGSVGSAFELDIAGVRRLKSLLEQHIRYCEQKGYE